MLSRNIVISLVTGSILGFSVSLFTLHMMSDTDLGLWSQRSQYSHKNESFHRDEARKVSVLCWIMTQPENHKIKVRVKSGNISYLYSYLYTRGR